MFQGDSCVVPDHRNRLHDPSEKDLALRASHAGCPEHADSQFSDGDRCDCQVVRWLYLVCHAPTPLGVDQDAGVEDQSGHS